MVECSGLDSGGGAADGGAGDSVVGGGGGGGGIMQTNTAQVTTPSAFGDEDNSCDSHTRWGKEDGIFDMELGHLSWWACVNPRFDIKKRESACVCCLFM